MLAADPFKASKPESIARNVRRERAANFEDPLPRPNNLPKKHARAGIALDPEDAVRLRLRERARQVKYGANVGRNLELVSLPGNGSLSFAMRYIDGGRDAFVEFIQMCVLENQPNAVAWYEVFRDLTAYERKLVSYDDVCAAAGVQPSKLMGEVISVVMEMGRDVGNLAAAMTHPKVVEAAYKSAQRIDGDHAEIALKDRHALLQGAGLIPTPRGTTVHVSASANAKAAAAAANEPTMPGFSAALSSARQVHQKAIEAAPADADLGFLNAEREVQPQEAVLVGQEDED